MSKRKSPYASTPAVPEKVIAGKNPVGTVDLGSMISPTVPKEEGASHGFGPQVHQFGTPHIKGSHGFGHPLKAKHGHLRMSGNPLAHRLGKK